MRILQIRFKNLNSLWGEWKIDLTHSAFADGIFAITGPTGAGKTTILDAICLGLYGRTPRLKDLTQSTNELMSRQTGECFAEVIFEAGPSNAQGKYAATWSQHRAHKKPDGALQQPKHELADISMGSILETRQRNVDAKIEEITGLSFDQFIRSMLLAQGDFAAFLQSSAGERSPILEQITGTEIYSHLSSYVHELRGAKRAQLAAKELELSSLKALNAEERAALEADLKTKIAEETTLYSHMSDCRNQLDWINSLTSLEQELEKLEEQHFDLSRRENDFSEDAKRMENAVLALEFGGAYASLLGLRKEQESEKKLRSECQAKLPELEADVRRAGEAFQLAGSALVEKQTEQKNGLELLRKIRELDFKEREKNPLIEECLQVSAQLEKTFGELKGRHEIDREQLEKAHIKMRDLQKALQANVADERLLEQLGTIRSRFEVLAASQEKLKHLSKELEENEKNKREASSHWNELSALYETIKAKFSTVEKNIQKLRGNIESTLDGQTLSELRETMNALTNRKNQQLEIEETLRKRIALQGDMEEIKSKNAALAVLRNKNELKIAAQQEKIKVQENEKKHLENEVVLLTRVRDLEENRAHLQDGEPCPLCGSTVHPYATGNIPDMSDIQVALTQTLETLTQEQGVLTTLLAENIGIDRELADNHSASEELLSLFQENEEQLLDKMAALQMKLPSDSEPLVEAARLRQKTEEKLQNAFLNVERAERIEKELISLRDELDKIRSEQEQTARKLQESEFKKESAGKESERLLQELRICKEDLNSLRLDLIHQISPFGFKNIPDEQPEHILNLLEERSRTWQDSYKQRIELEKQISAWERDLHHVQSHLDKLNLELKDKYESCKKLRSERDSLHQQRTALFGEKNAEDEEKRLAEIVETAQNHLETKRTAREKVLQDFANLQSRIDELGKTIHIREDILQKAELSFSKQLTANGFKNEEVYLSFCLPENERRSLQEKAQALLVERSELEARRTDKKFATEELRRKHLATEGKEEIAHKLMHTEACLKKLQHEIGAFRQRLLDDEHLSGERRRHMEIVENHRKELDRWNKLHDLIGSADGQKYRNFVQGLTFDMVIHHANTQLQKITDRYLLLRSENDTLDLKVMDNYQAGEIRSTQNLSGGESFIVSLALALGLSQMASRKIRVDSLFLDEGFGTLDEEALDSALSALSGLRREGKMIGVISHVGALKERIGTQIEVIPQGNGRSFIQAPGCSRIEPK